MERILTQLKEIEQKHKIVILHACETGSRGWGFPSPDSDYDVRFIYRHDPEWYLSLGQQKDTIEVMLNDELDITGWDLKKSLLMMKKSNAALIERFQSPVEYFSKPGFRDEFKVLTERYYSPTTVFYHHLSLAKNFWEELKDAESIKLKGYFYFLRSLLSCRWIMETKELVPMDIEGLMSSLETGKKEFIRSLIKLKSTVGEKYTHPRKDLMEEWILDLWKSVQSPVKDLGVNSTDFSLLNSFFLKTLYVDNRYSKN